MSEAKKRQEEIVAQFSSISSWEDRYKKIIALGKELSPIPEKYQTEDYLVKGCQSQVWMHAEMNEQGGMDLMGDSDAMIVKGLVALLLKAYSGLPPQEITQNPPTFIEELGFQEYLSPSRANGFLSMVKQIMLYATALQMTYKSKI